MERTFVIVTGAAKKFQLLVTVTLCNGPKNFISYRRLESTYCRLKIVTFWRTFRHDGIFGPAWCHFLAYIQAWWYFRPSLVPLSGVHSGLMVFSAQLDEVGEYTPSPFHFINPLHSSNPVPSNPPSRQISQEKATCTVPHGPLVSGHYSTAIYQPFFLTSSSVSEHQRRIKLFYSMYVMVKPY